jgi:3-methyladenine DNA glycosylase AlkD
MFINKRGILVPGFTSLVVASLRRTLQLASTLFVKSKSFTMHPYVQSLLQTLSKKVNGEKAGWMKAYMKNQFEFSGIQTPERRKICKEHAKQYVLDNPEEVKEIVKGLWAQPEREFQYCAMEILLCNKKLWHADFVDLIEYLVVTKSWWDTVDFLAADCAGTYFKLFPAHLSSITATWNHSNNMWLQRSSLLFQKNYKKDTDTKLLKEYILQLAPSKEFFIQKAIGWILREYAKTNPQWVQAFTNENTLAPLSKREALKHF